MDNSTEKYGNWEVEPENIEAAMAKVAESTSLGRSTNVGNKPGEPASKQVLIRANEYDHERWKTAALARGVTLSEFIRDCLNAKAAEILDCSHPMNQRRWYPWAEMCLACGERLRTQPPKKQKR